MEDHERRLRRAVLVERERCAKIVEDETVREDESLRNQFSTTYEIERWVRRNIAAKIREGK